MFRLIINLPLFNKLHQIEEIQISYAVMGTGKLIVADIVHLYEAGKKFVSGKNIPHLFQSIESDTESNIVSLFLKRSTFGIHDT